MEFNSGSNHFLAQQIGRLKQEIVSLFFEGLIDPDEDGSDLEF